MKLTTGEVLGRYMIASIASIFIFVFIYVFYQEYLYGPVVYEIDSTEDEVIAAVREFKKVNPQFVPPEISYPPEVTI